MSRVLLLLPTSTYRAPDFLEAARSLGAEVVVASEEPQALADQMADRSLVVPCRPPEAGAEAIVAFSRENPVDAVVAVDDQGVVVAAMAAARLGLRANDPAAVARTRDKAAMRAALEGLVDQPSYAVVGRQDDLAAAVRRVGLPVVVKPVALSASRGVIRADSHEEALAASVRIRSLLADAGEDADGQLLVESYLPGAEVAVEALLTDGRIHVLAIFDKPDPLEGPFFEETIYVTPSRLPEPVQERIGELAAAAAAAIGLEQGPVHAEFRIDGDRVWILELAARSIGGLCARTLRFGLGISLEEVILRHALGRRLDRLRRESGASGVMMLPIPATGVLVAVDGQDLAAATPNVAGLEITVHPGELVRALPEGDRYLGFLFARAATPAEVEAALRTAHECLTIRIEPDHG